MDIEDYVRAAQVTGTDKPLRILHALSKSGETISRLRTITGIKLKSLSAVMRALLNDGHILSTPMPSDRRIRLVTITKRGRARYAKLAKDVLSSQGF